MYRYAFFVFFIVTLNHFIVTDLKSSFLILIKCTFTYSFETNTFWFEIYCTIIKYITFA